MLSYIESHDMNNGINHIYNTLNVHILNTCELRILQLWCENSVLCEICIRYFEAPLSGSEGWK